MWQWFKRKPAPPSGELEELAKKWVGPQSLAIAIAEAVRAYAEDVRTGRITYPAYRRRGASVVEIWHDLRLEALNNLFNLGEADPFLLSDQFRQAEMLACFLDERPHLEMPQPRGETAPDTIQAMWRVYVYLDKAGSEVADRETDRATLKLERRSILDDLTSKAQALRGEWEAYERVLHSEQQRPLPKMPGTLIEVLFEDVTMKTKSIALSSIFGPSYEAGIKYAEDLAGKGGGANFRASIERVMAAKDPDELGR